MRYPRRAPVLFALVISVLVAMGAVGALTALEPAETTYHGTTQYFPSLHSRGAAAALAGGGATVLGMEGFGDSIVDLQDRSGEPNKVELRLSTSHFRDVIVNRSLEPRQGASVALKAQDAITLGRYWAVMKSDHPVGAVARLEWNGGAAAAYEAPPPAKNLILPIFVRNVYSHTTIFIAQNASTSGAKNEVEYSIFDNIDGAPLLSISARMEQGAIAIYDTWFDATLFGKLPVNAAGGSLYSLRISGEQPVSVMAYGDEMAGEGSSAHVARQVAEADTLQYLPVVRSNYLGDSLIAITNPSLANNVSVTVSYHGQAPGIAGRDEQYQHQFDINARGSAFIDMSTLGRGNQTSPVPRGSGTNRGFFGSAIIEADRPILAAVQEEARYASVVQSINSYNALGSEDLSTQLAVSRLRNPRGGRGTYVVLQNPGMQAAETGITHLGLAGNALSSYRVTIPGRSIHIVASDPGLPEESQLSVTSDAMLGGVVYETTLHAPSDWGRWGLDTLSYSVASLLADYETPTPAPPTETPLPTSTFTPTVERPPTSTPEGPTEPPPTLPYKAFLPSTHA